jgi:cell division septation protein DedD
MGAVRDVREDIDIPMPAMGPASYRVARRSGMDPNTRRLAMIAGGIGGALVLLIGGWEIAGHHRHGVPVVEADSGPVKVKPDNPGGMKVAGANDEILSGAADDDGKAAMAPPPETPDPKALKAAEQKAAKTAAPAPAAPPPVAAIAPAAPAPVAPPVQAAAPPAKAAPAKPAPAAKVTPAPAGRGAAVQLAAMASEEAARAEWQRLEHKMPGLLGGRKPEVSRIEHDGKTFWRLRTSGFASAADATSFCDKLKAKGAGCAVATF